VSGHGIHGTYIGNSLFADKEHRLARAFDGDLRGATILGTSTWQVVGGFENRIPSGGDPSLSPEIDQVQKWGSWGSIERPMLYLDGTGFRLTQQTKTPLPENGELGEVRWVDDGKVSALWIKTKSGWMNCKLQK
jgi:hypothetical protein